MEAVKGRDCPQCNQPNMEWIGVSIHPLRFTKGDRIEDLSCDFYHCKICNHVEWVAKNE